MKSSTRTILGRLVAVAAVAAAILPAQAVLAHDGFDVNPLAARRFATMPEVANFPEGIAVNPYTGDVYVSTFEFDTSGTETNGVVRFNRHGRVLAVSDFSSNIPLLGMAFNPRDFSVYIASVGNFQGMASTIKRLPADFSDGAVLEDVAGLPPLGAPPNRTVGNPDGSEDTIEFGNGAAVPNAITFNDMGVMYVTDSFKGAIYKVDDPTACTGACVADLVVQDGRLATAGFPPFGANGIAIRPGTLFPLYIANTGDDRILTFDPNAPDDEKFAVFAESIDGADGIAFDRHGKLWIAANQRDQIISLDENGRIADVLGAFLGVRRNGAVRGLMFPASIALRDHDLVVTNLAIPLDGVGSNEWEEEISRYTVSRIPLPRGHRR